MRLSPLGLYSAIKFPVPRGTPMISPAVRWDHSQSWAVADKDNFLTEGLGCMFEIDLSPESKYHFIIDHRINGLDLFPASGYLTLAWRALARAHGQLFTQMPVTFSNVLFHRATILPKSGMYMPVNSSARMGKYLKLIKKNIELIKNKMQHIYFFSLSKKGCFSKFY